MKLATEGLAVLSAAPEEELMPDSIAPDLAKSVYRVDGRQAWRAAKKVEGKRLTIT